MVKEVAIQFLSRNKVYLFQITQHLQGITSLISLVVDWQDIEVGTTLRIKNEQQTIDEDQTVITHHGLKVIIRLILIVELIIRRMLDIPNSLVSQSLHCCNHTTLQVLRHSIGILIALLFQLLHQWRIANGSKSLTRNQKIKQSEIVAHGTLRGLHQQTFYIKAEISTTLPLVGIHKKYHIA